MKRVVACIVANLMIILAFSPTLAIEVNAIKNDQHQKEIEYYAYMDIENADSSMQKMIIEARNEMIFSENWVANGVSGRIVDEEGNVVEELPQFSEVFPEEWEVPFFDVSDEAEVDPSAVPYATGGVWGPLFEGSVVLRIPSATTTTAPFYSVSTSAFVGTQYEYYYSSLSTCGYCGDGVTYNIGYANATTGKSLGYVTELEEGKSFMIDPPRNIKVAIRASTYVNPNRSWTMQVYGYSVDVY